MAETPSVGRVAVALFEGFTVLDVYGPVQAFASTRLTRPDGSIQRLFEIVTMAEQAGRHRHGAVGGGAPAGDGHGPPVRAVHGIRLARRSGRRSLRLKNTAPDAVLSHEMAHLLGAFHPAAGRSDTVMSGGPAARFDGQTARMIRLMRGYGFARGVGGLDPDVRRAASPLLRRGRTDVPLVLRANPAH